MLCLVFVFWYLSVHDDIDVNALVTETIEEHIIVCCTWYLQNGTWCQKYSYPCSKTWASEGFFPGAPLADFYTGNHKIFPGGQK